MDGSDDEEEEEAEEEEEEEEDEEERAVDEAREQRRLEAETDAYAIEKVLDSRPRGNRSAAALATLHTCAPLVCLALVAHPLCVPRCSAEVEYLVQWHGDSHLYDTWHTVREAQALCESGRGLKKLSNFIAREREASELRQAVSMEEVEQMNVAAEMVRQEREEWVKVEKIIASREQPTFLVQHLQRIRKRRRTFRLADDAAPQSPPTPPKAEEEEEETKAGPPLMEETREEKEERVVRVQHTVESDDMRVEVEEKTTVTTVITDTSLQSPLPTTSLDTPMTLEPSEPAPIPVKGEDEDVDAVMADDPPTDAEAPAAEEEGDQEEESDEEDGALYDDGTTVSQYFVKWRGLAHEDCTWEAAEDIAAYQASIDDFLDLERSTSTKPPSGPLNRKFRPIKEQPVYLQQGVLREYQMAGLEWLVHNWCSGINSSQRSLTCHSSRAIHPLRCLHPD